MAFYENTIVARQDLAEVDLKAIKEKYNDVIIQTSGKVLKIEEWGLLNFAYKIKNFNKGFYIHFKFQGNISTINEFKKKIRTDDKILRHLVVRYKKLDLEKNYFE